MGYWRCNTRWRWWVNDQIMKVLLLLFKQAGKTKYSLEAMHLLFDVTVALSKKRSHELTWNRTCNKYTWRNWLQQTIRLTLGTLKMTSASLLYNWLNPVCRKLCMLPLLWLSVGQAHPHKTWQRIPCWATAWPGQAGYVYFSNLLLLKYATMCMGGRTPTFKA